VDELYVVGKHGAGGVKVGNHPVFEGSDCFDRLGGFPQHPFGLATDSHHLLGFFVPRYNRGLTDDNPFIPHPHERIGSSKINTQIMREETEQPV